MQQAVIWFLFAAFGQVSSENGNAKQSGKVWKTCSLPRKGVCETELMDVWLQTLSGMLKEAEGVIVGQWERLLEDTSGIVWALPITGIRA